MRRGVAPALAMLVVLSALTLTSRRALADELDPQIESLAHAESYKVRLAAAISLSKSRDPRAVIALATAIIRDDEATIRRVCALGLGKMVDETTQKSARELALDALEHATKSDRDAKVREAAQKAYSTLSALHAPEETGPAVFVNIGGATDLTKKAPRDVEKRLAGIIKVAVKRTQYAVDWPGGGLPKQRDLAAGGTRAFYVAATVAMLDIATKGAHSEIACTVSIRVAPWNGTDGAEKWEASKAASASGSGKAVTGASQVAIDNGIRDCVLAVAEEVTDRQVVPFLKRLASSR